MEFLFGSLVTLLAIITSKFYLNKTKKLRPSIVPSLSQAQKFELVRPYYALMLNALPDPIDTQASRHYNATSVRVLFSDGKAYWIANNAVYTADINEEGTVEEESTTQLDIIGMDAVELDKISFIVEKLTEGKRNDNWSSGNS